jgi:hypothetical protein
MQPEQAPHYYGSFNRQPVGTTLEHGHQIDLHASELELLEARADIDAATRTQPLEEAVQKRLEYRPLMPQEVIKMIGQKVVFDLRKGYNENHINLYDDADVSSTYIYSPEAGQSDRSDNLTRETLVEGVDGLSKTDVDLAA